MVVIIRTYEMASIVIIESPLTKSTRIGEEDTTLLISRNNGGSDGRHGVSCFSTFRFFCNECVGCVFFVRRLYYGRALNWMKWGTVKTFFQ